MKREEFLSLRHWPALLSIEETAWVLGVEQYYIMVLVAANLLRPAGKPAANGRKFFGREYILERAKDEAWLGRAATAMVNFNASRNHGRTTHARNTEKAQELAAA